MVRRQHRSRAFSFLVHLADQRGGTESGISRRRLGTLFVEALDGVILVLRIPDPDQTEDSATIPVERDDGSTNIRKRKAA